MSLTTRYDADIETCGFICHNSAPVCSGSFPEPSLSHSFSLCHSLTHTLLVQRNPRCVISTSYEHAPSLMLISSTVQVIVINQLASDQALPSTAASSQPALCSLLMGPPQLWLSCILDTSAVSYSPLLRPGCVCLGLSVCPLGFLFTGTSRVFLSCDRTNQRRIMNS